NLHPMQSPYKMRVRITFAKTKAMRYTSHLDLRSTWERTMRRAKLPLAYSQGYNPRPKFNLASALPLGFTSEAEMIEMWFDERRSIAAITAALEPVLPPGLALIQIEEVDLHAEKLPNLLQSAAYTVTLLEHEPSLDKRVTNLRDQTSIMRERRGKSYDLRLLIEDLRLDDSAPHGEQNIIMRLSARPGATGRPDEVLEALGINPYDTLIRRTRLFLGQG
ncbi:MAG: TIGR03936 family radical SAM-associated protein, partial [Chloroflexota bacterium]|nr:TIGR03936 family radical SAM-associated protein [Chloroflexota bacterium]